MLRLTDHHFALRDRHLPEVNESLMLDYVCGAGGIYARGRRPGMEACMPIGYARVRGLKGVEPYVQWGYPKVPAELLALMFSISQTVARNQPCEALFYLSFSLIEPASGRPAHVACANGWHLEFPAQSADAEHVEAREKGAGTSEESAVIEVHSHHRFGPEFSERDDADEGTMSFRVYAVIGNIFVGPAIRARVGLFGHFLEYPASEFFEMPEGVVDRVRSL